jgi:Metal-independent alpha-mannosidase (GH125)
VWPLSWTVEALTNPDAARRAQLLRWALGAQCGNGLMHESIDVTDEVRMLPLPWDYCVIDVLSVQSTADPVICVMPHVPVTSCCSCTVGHAVHPALV